VRLFSLEIAKLCGKNHKDAMRAIRKMEPAWEKTCGLKFQLTSRTIIQPNGGTRKVPCYQLTKTECLYIATKFNDEARAKLVLRWEQLERQQLGSSRQQLMLPAPERILQLADHRKSLLILGD
jgi:phage regulator Rha-like protein